jgi:hypothetical protein
VENRPVPLDDARFSALASELVRALQVEAEVDRSRARHDLISRVLAAVRRLDEAVTLRGILDALVDGASEEASRVAVLLVDDSTLRGYRSYGFSPGAVPTDLALDASAAMFSAVSLRETVVVDPGVETDDRVPSFLHTAPGQMGLVLPLVVEQAVVAVVYAEGPGPRTGDRTAPVWSEQVEVLVRHGSARLESVTSRRTVEVLTGST